MCCKSLNAVNYIRKSILWCAAIAGNLPETMRECMRGAHSVSNHKHCMIENQYSGVLQVAKCCKTLWRRDGALCRQSSVNSICDRKATDVPLVFLCFALVFFDFPVFSFGVEVFSVGPLQFSFSFL